MAQLTAEQIDRTIESCRAHLPETGETFRANLDCPVRLTSGEPHPYTADALAAFDGPGLAISFSLGEQGLVLLIPESIQLPPWYRQPGLSENNRLQTFAHELSLQLLPADLQADRYAAGFAANLKEYAEQAAVNSSAQSIDDVGLRRRCRRNRCAAGEIAPARPGRCDSQTGAARRRGFSAGGRLGRRGDRRFSGRRRPRRRSERIQRVRPRLAKPPCRRPGSRSRKHFVRCGSSMSPLRSACGLPSARCR